MHTLTDTHISPQECSFQIQLSVAKKKNSERNICDLWPRIVCAIQHEGFHSVSFTWAFRILFYSSIFQIAHHHFAVKSEMENTRLAFCFQMQAAGEVAFDKQFATVCCLMTAHVWRSAVEESHHQALYRINFKWLTVFYMHITNLCNSPLPYWTEIGKENWGNRF